MAFEPSKEGRDELICKLARQMTVEPTDQIVALTTELARLKRERADSEHRISLLRPDRLDPDMLDERARYQLDYANPHDLVRMTGPN